MTGCYNCDSSNTTVRDDVEVFQYGPDGNCVTLRAVVPVFTCMTCGARWTDYRGEEARSAAVTQYLESLKS